MRVEGVGVAIAGVDQRAPGRGVLREDGRAGLLPDAGDPGQERGACARAGEAKQRAAINGCRRYTPASGFVIAEGHDCPFLS